MSEEQCTCGNYESYGSTIPPNVPVAAMMPFDACVNCYPESQGFTSEPVDEIETYLEQLRKRRDRIKKRKEKENES
jgi:hypothetical protein